MSDQHHMFKPHSMKHLAIVGAPGQPEALQIVMLDLADLSFPDFAEGFPAQFRADLFSGCPAKGVLCAQ